MYLSEEEGIQEEKMNKMTKKITEIMKFY